MPRYIRGDIMRIKKMIASATLVTAGIASSIGIAPSANASTSNPEPTPGQTIVLTARVTGSAIAGASGAPR